MTTFQDIKKKLKTINLKSRKLAMMSREDIFDFLAEITFVSDELTDFIRDLDTSIGDCSADLVKDNPSISATAMRNMIKSATASLEADKAWASRQCSNLKDLRISALAAQRDL